MIENNRYDILLAELTAYQQEMQNPPSLQDPWSLMEYLHRLSALQARAGAIVGETAMLKGQMEAEFVKNNKDDFNKLPPTKFAMLMPDFDNDSPYARVPRESASSNGFRHSCWGVV